MVPLLDLWMPIVLSAVAVFIASSIVWMALPHHKSDYKKVTNEDRLLDTVRECTSGAGSYYFPWCKGAADLKDPAVKARFEKGPWGMITVWGKQPNMGASLGIWFVYLLLVSFVTAYLSATALPYSASFMSVFRFSATGAGLAYAIANIPSGVWKGEPWPAVIKHVIDGVVYALITGGIFAWLWPSVPVA